jgi:integrase
MKLYRRGSVYWCDFTVAGTRYRVSTDESTKSAAQTAADNLRAKALQGAGLKPVPVPLLKEWAKTFLGAKKKQAGLSTETLDDYLYSWGLMEKQPIATIRLDRITTMDVQTIKIDGSNATHNHALRTLRCMLNMAVDQGIITRDRAPGMPRFPKIELLEETRRQGNIGADDDRKIEQALNDRSAHFGSLRYAWPIHADAGLRPKEIVNLRIEDIDLLAVPPVLHIRKSKSRSSQRTLPITERMKAAIVHQMAGRSEGWLFPSNRRPGEHITREALTHAFANVRERADLAPNKVLYGARHTFGRDLMKRSRDPYLVAAAMGHADLSVGKWYQEVTVDEVAQAVSERNTERTAMVQ